MGGNLVAEVAAVLSVPSLREGSPRGAQMPTQRELGYSGIAPGRSLTTSTAASPSVTKRLEENARRPAAIIACAAEIGEADDGADRVDLYSLGWLG